MLIGYYTYTKWLLVFLLKFYFVLTTIFVRYLFASQNRQNCCLNHPQSGNDCDGQELNRPITTSTSVIDYLSGPVNITVILRNITVTKIERFCDATNMFKTNLFVNESMADYWKTFQKNNRRTGHQPDGSTPTTDVTCKWRVPTDGTKVEASPVVGFWGVAIQRETGLLYNLDEETGRLDWAFNVGSAPATAVTISNPISGDPTVYAPSREHNGNSSLFAINQKSGHIRWESELDATIYSAPAVESERVVFGDTNGTLHALNAETGEHEWQFDGEEGINPPPAVANGTVYVGSTGGKLYAIDLDSGRLEWAVMAQDNINAAPAVANGTVYFGSWDGNLYAVDVDTGSIQWDFETKDSIMSSPALANETVFVGSSDHSLYAVNAETGAQEWTLSTEDRVTSSPAVCDETVYVGSCDGGLYAVDAVSGEQQFRFETNDAVRSSPAICEGTIFVGSDDGHVYALE